MEFIFVAIIFQGIVVGSFCSYVAGQKNRSKGNWFILGFFFSFLALLALIAVPRMEWATSSVHVDTTTNFQPLQPPIQQRAASERTFEGEKDITLPAYQFFLTERFSIEKNQTLDKFIIDQTVFDTLEDSIREAHSRYELHLSRMEREERRRRLDKSETE